MSAKVRTSPRSYILGMTVRLRSALLAGYALLALAAVPAGAACGDAAMDRAWRALIATDYVGAATAFEAAAAECGTPADREPLYQAALAWTMAQDTASLSKGAAILNALLTTAEPEEPVYAKAMLMQAWNSLARGDTAAARSQYLNAEPSLPPEEGSRALWICAELMRGLDDRRAADSCALALRKRHPKSLEALYGVRSAEAAAPVAPIAPAPAPAPKSETPAASSAGAPAPAEQPASAGAAPVGQAIARPGSPAARAKAAPARPAEAEAAVAAPESRPAAPAPATDPRIDPKGGWCLQLGAFSDKGNAERLVSKLSGLPGELRVVQMPSGRHTLHLVRLFAFPTKEQAESFWIERIKPMGLGIVAQARSLR